jgi:hypothetical protein
MSQAPEMDLEQLFCECARAFQRPSTSSRCADRTLLVARLPLRVAFVTDVDCRWLAGPAHGRLWMFQDVLEQSIKHSVTL